jgi:anti-anti-sigma regulatory factor
MPEMPNVALAIHPGEHACARLPSQEDRDRLAAAFIRDGLARGNKIVYLIDREDGDSSITELISAVEEAGPALERGQFVVREVANGQTPDGGEFDARAQVERLREAHRTALAEGYAGMSFTGDGTWALASLGPDGHGLPEYELELNEVFEDDTVICLCQYDHAQFDAGTLTAVAESHAVDVSPELAMISRSGYLAAAWLRTSGSLRLAGELDFGCADSLVQLLAAYYHGDLQMDLGDLHYVDVTGLRALRGRPGQSLTITSASPEVRRLVDLLAWDTDPEVYIAA